LAFLIHSNSDDPFSNLATEEYLLQSRTEDFVFIYTNEPTVVIGKHQNIFDECQLDICERHGVLVARRLSGGGTVFHGPGNINFSFIQNLKPGEPMVDFRKHLGPIISFLHSIGIPAEFSGRNDLLLDGFKISGSAEHVYQKKKRLIHHGTLLFNADLSLLSGSISPKTKIEFIGHAIKSVRSQVTNILPHIPKVLSENEFVNKLIAYLTNHFEAQIIELSGTENDKIKDLVLKKYQTWEWIFGYSPPFEAKTENGWRFKIKKGIVQQAKLEGEIIDEVIGMRFEPLTFEKYKNCDWF
jgi:lipoate---protein ligase